MADGSRNDQEDNNKSASGSDSSELSELGNNLAAVRKLIDGGEADKAFKALRKLYDSHPDHPEVCFLLGDCHARKPDLSQAAEWFSRSVAIDPGSPRNHNALITTFMSADRVNEAIQALLAAARDSSDPLSFYSWLERVYIDRGDSAGASALVAEIRTRYEGQPELPYILGEAAVAVKLYASAIDFFRQCYDKGFVGKFMHQYLGTSFAYCGYDSYAIAFYREALRKDRGNAVVLDGLHDLLFWRLKSGNEKLISAIEWQRSVTARRLGPYVQLEYLGVSGEQHLRVFEDWLNEENTPPNPYTCFCEFYKDLLRSKPDFSSNWYNAADSLLSCVAHLTLKGEERHAMYYRAWHLLLTEKTETACQLFATLSSIEDTPEWMKAESSLFMVEASSAADTPEESTEAEAADMKTNPAGGRGKRDRKRALVDIQAFGTDLSALIQKGVVAPAASLGNTLATMCDVLANFSGRGVVLVGPPGVGKTTAIQQLACFLQTDKAPEELKGFSVFQTSTTRIVSGAMYIGTWQKNLEQLCLDGSVRNKIIIYFEDLSNILGAGITVSDSSSFVDYLIPRIEMKEILVIGEMESSQLQAACDREPRFARLMQEIHIAEPPPESIQGSIKGLAKLEGAKYGLQFTADSLAEVLELSSTYMPYRAFPGKAAEIVRSAISHFGRVDRAKHVTISAEDIVLTFCELTGIPGSLVDRRQLLDSTELRQFFSDRILGQLEAVDELTAAIATFKGRMCDPRKPLRSFLFVGPTGVGKTEAAKVLAEYVFGSRDRLIHVNMSEYSDGSTGLSKLIGVHWTDKKTSRLVDAIRSQPFSVVLLDEIEKASDEVRNLLLQILDEGVLIAGDGKPVRFQSTFIIMTSNIGSRRYTSRSIGFGSDAVAREAREGVLSDIREFFSPEIFNRFDEVVCFEPLSREVLGTIINREIGKVLERRGVVTANLSIDIDPMVKDHIIATGFDPRYGARHIKRAVEQSVALPLASLLASEAVENNSLIQVVMADSRPVASRVMDNFADAALSTPRILRSPAFESRLEDKELGKFIVSAEERLRGLMALLKVEEARQERENLQTEMAMPTFWDDHRKANQVLKRIAELTRIAERAGRWDYVLGQVSSVVSSAGGRRRREEISRAKERLIGLLKDIESAELEMLLEGRNDSADAFIVLSSEGATKQEVRWLLDLTDMYVGWSRRRGYRCIFVGEQADSHGEEPSIILHVCGMNAFGLLKNERGIHRRSVVQKTGSRDHRGARQVASRLNCRVLVLADLQNAAEKGQSCVLKITRITSPKRGWRLKQLSRKVHLMDRTTGVKLEFLTDTSMERDKELPLDLFLSYSYCSVNMRPTAGAQQRQLGSLVRTYESGDRSRILDHATKSTVHDSESFLQGNIDSVLLERLV